VSIVNKSFNVNLFTVTLLCFFYLLSGTNALTTNTKTLEGMKINLFQKLSNFPAGGKMYEIRETISQLIELSKQDEMETYQRSSFSILITKTRELVDGMVEEQLAGDILFRNTTQLLMKYHLRQEHALEMVQDKHQLMKYFVEFVNSIDETEGRIDVKTDYSKLLAVMQMLQSRYMDYQEFQKIFNEQFSKVYDDLKLYSVELKNKLMNNQNPYKSDGLAVVFSKLDSLRAAAQARLKSFYLYNVDPRLEMEMIRDYITYFQKQSQHESHTITPHFFPSFVKQEKEAKEEIMSLTYLLDQAKESLKLTEDSLKSNMEEYEANTKTRKDVIDVIYQILELMNKRAKKIKGYELKYIEECSTKIAGFENSFEFIKYKEYIFKGPTTKVLLSTPLPKIPELPGVEDNNAQAPSLEDHVPLLVNNSTTTVTF
jgi:hypothetical protein